MILNDGVSGLTVGSVTIGTNTDGTYWPNGWPYDSGTSIYQWTWPPVPTYCSGDVHVFACSHTATCKCGKASRKIECGVCGK